MDRGMPAVRRICMLLAWAVVLMLLPACAGGIGMKDPSGRIRIENGSFVLDNTKIRITVDRESGYIRTVENRTAAVSFKDEKLGAWPFSIRFGENNQQCSITKDTASTVTKYRIWTEGDISFLDLYYDDLKLDWNGGSTGVRAVSHLSIAADAEYVTASVTLDLKNASGNVNSVTFFEGGGLSCHSEGERLTAPTWGGGTWWADPSGNRDFRNGVSLGYPGKDNRTLECGWLDLHDEKAGIGIALIDRMEMPAEFKITADQGLSLSCVMLRPENIANVQTPILKGQEFISDTMLLAPHTGDWHTMADLYRAEYEKAFVTTYGNPDYLTWDAISAKAKKADYMIRYFAGLDGELVTTFDDMYKNTVSLINRIGADPARCMVWIAGQNEKGYAFNVPIMVPSFPPAGGDEALKRLDEDLHALGATVFHYEHPFAVDPDDAGYFPGTDPLQHTETWNLCTHHSVCVDNDTMQNLWADRIIPDIRSLGADGLQFDQCPLQQTICILDGHSHGKDTVSILSSHSKGVEALEKMVRKDLGSDAYIVTEAFNDILCRFIDIRQACWHVEPLWDGEYEFCASQYTFPQYIVQSTSIYREKDGGTSSAILFGAVSGGIECISDGATDTIRKEYIRFKTAVREADAPGYPYGFRDDLGLSFDTDALTAKVFTDGERITVTWLTRAQTDGETIAVDLDRLGFTGKGMREVRVGASAINVCGYEILEP